MLAPVAGRLFRATMLCPREIRERCIATVQCIRRRSWLVVKGMLCSQASSWGPVSTAARTTTRRSDRSAFNRHDPRTCVVPGAHPKHKGTANSRRHMVPAPCCCVASRPTAHLCLASCSSTPSANVLSGPQRQPVGSATCQPEEGWSSCTFRRMRPPPSS